LAYLSRSIKDINVSSHTVRQPAPPGAEATGLSHSTAFRGHVSHAGWSRL